MADDEQLFGKNKKPKTTIDEEIFGPPDATKGLGVASTNRRDKREGGKPINRVNLIPKQFDEFIEDQGILVRVTPVILCPNTSDLGSTNHVLDCPLCNGDQVLEVPEQAVEDWAIIQSVKQDKKLEDWGIFDVKDATMTIKQKVRLYYWYKVEILDFASVYNEVFKRGGGDTDKCRYNPAIKTDVKYNLVDSAGKHYEYDKHFKIENKLIKWKTSVRPVSGTLYSVSYPVLPTFRVLELIHDHRYYYVDFKRQDKVPINLPQQVVLRWDYFAKRSGTEVIG
jgi:hypothetical protein